MKTALDERKGTAQPTPVDVSIIIVTRTRSDLLRDCLESIVLTTPLMNTRVIVVDNGSQDDSLQMLKERFPQVLLITNRENLGFAKANNQAIPSCRGRYILLLNNDTILLEKALQTLVRFMDLHPEVGCVGPKLLNADGSTQPSCMRFPSLLRSLPNFVRARQGEGVKYVPEQQADPVYVDVVSGACMMIRPGALEETGLFDEGFFMYAEERDWCYRANQAGWRTAYCPSSEVIHLGGQTAAAEPARFYVERRYSRVRFFMKHHGWLSARLADAMIRLVIMARWTLGSGGGRAYYGQILSAYNSRVRALYAKEAGR